MGAPDDADEPRSLSDAGWRAAEEACWKAALKARSARRRYDLHQEPADIDECQTALAETQAHAREATVQIRAARRAGVLPEEAESREERP